MQYKEDFSAKTIVLLKSKTFWNPIWLQSGQSRQIMITLKYRNSNCKNSMKLTRLEYNLERHHKQETPEPTHPSKHL